MMTASELKKLYEAATKPAITFGSREDGSMWLSFGSPIPGVISEHWQADWEFGWSNAALFQYLHANVPNIIKLLEKEEQSAIQHEQNKT
jgi:hypothetical protein